MNIHADSSEEYLAQLPDDRREALTHVREAILKVLPKGYEETMQYGYITYVVPHSIFPAGYHCKPTDALPFLSIANTKGHMSIHLMGIYMNNDLRDQFEAAYAASGKKLDMGAACLRFKKLENLALDVVCDAVASMTVEKYVERYQSILDSQKSRQKKK